MDLQDMIIKIAFWLNFMYSPVECQIPGLVLQNSGTQVAFQVELVGESKDLRFWLEFWLESVDQWKELGLWSKNRVLAPLAPARFLKQLFVQSEAESGKMEKCLWFCIFPENLSNILKEQFFYH